MVFFLEKFHYYIWEKKLLELSILRSSNRIQFKTKNFRGILGATCTVPHVAFQYRGLNWLFVTERMTESTRVQHELSTITHRSAHGYQQTKWR